MQLEQHGDQTLWVHRKGANQAADGVANIIPGSMATHTYHVEGRGADDALCSSSHGAGRRLSRGAARARISRKDLFRQLAAVWIEPQTAARLVDEAPPAYKDLDAVTRATRARPHRPAAAAGAVLQGRLSAPAQSVRPRGALVGRRCAAAELSAP